VQPHSGSQANQAVFFALLNPGDTFMGLKLDDGGHLTHGLHVNMSGKWFKPVSYGVRSDNHYIDHDQVYELAKAHKPRLIIAGGSAYSRIIDFEFFRKVADEVGAYLMVDMAHFSGLVAGGIYPSPLPFADVVTSTTHKTLRGPRGGIILTNNDEIAKKVNSAVFPGLQGGPLMHVIAAKAVAFAEALQDDFKSYTKNIVTNAKVMEKVFLDRGVNMVSGGTDSHLLLLDLRNYNVTGKDIAHALEQVNITCNKNGVPADHRPPTITSGIRIGTPAITTRGFGEKECEEVAHMIVDVIEAHQQGDFDSKILTIQTKVAALCEKFPIYTNL
jgi:glycine hydroxymethyltransferase